MHITTRALFGLIGHSTNFKRSKGTNRPVKASREVEEGGTGVNFDHRDFP